MPHHLPIWAVALVLALAVVIGVVASPYARRLFDRNPGGDFVAGDFGYITAPLVGLVTLALSFSLISAWGSFQEARVTAAQEALAVDYQSDMAQLLPDANAKREMEATLLCYARAVAGPEWESLRQRGESSADEVDPWTDRIQTELGQLASAKGGITPIGSEILRADKERGDARGKRLIQARASVPFEMFLLLLSAAALAVVALALAHLPLQLRWLHVAALAMVALFFFAFIQVIAELDSPYSGLINTNPDDMTRVAINEAADFAEAYPGYPLPCDDSGRLLS